MIIVAEIMLCMRPANGRWRYNVTSSLIDWVHTQIYPCCKQVTGTHMKIWRFGGKKLNEWVWLDYNDR